MGRARAEASCFDAEARGPNVRLAAEAGVQTGIIARIEPLGGLEANVGPVGIRLAPNLDTGASVGLDGVSVAILGMGVSLRPDGVELKTPIGSIVI